MICVGSQPLIVEKYGGVISYIPPTATNQNYVYKTITCSDPVAPEVSLTFSEGELVLSLFVFIILILMLWDLTYRQFIGNRIKKYK